MSEKIRFAHFSDCHLGRFRKQNESRYIDMFIGFRRALEIAIKQDPPIDFIIITGDLFNFTQPSVRTYELFFKILMKALEKRPDLKIFLIPGNHEFKSGLTSIKYNYGLKLLQYSRFFQNIIIIEDDIYLYRKNEKIPPILIYGLRFHPKDSLYEIENLYRSNKANEFQKDYPNAAKILMVHQYTSGMRDLGIDISQFNENDLKKLKFDYVGVGHNHIYWEKPQLKLICPGSTEHISRSEWIDPIANQEKYVVINELTFDVKSWSLIHNKISFPVRTKQQIIINIKKANFDEAYQLIESRVIEEVLEEACVYIKINGKLPIDEDRYFDLSQLRNQLKTEKKLVEIEIENNLYVDTGKVIEDVRGKEEILSEIISRILKLPEASQELYKNMITYIENSAEEIKNIDDFENVLEIFLD